MYNSAAACLLLLLLLLLLAVSVTLYVWCGWPAFRARQVLCDRAERYAGKLYNVSFLQGKGLPAPPWLESPPVTLADGMLQSCLIDAWPDEEQ